ncbi:type IIB DNA topoisomerase [Colletotrichum simmondsii]|uniref:DNA topoisomerase (ATP-hydrolyzing) n=1 Tax=Colletotrichum simmondsii TaxID=703756 RepID=A0A135TNQ8_9PEZI|nr:type IIB DNA topoisomerase [Colletotrichum simmondsii]
MRIMQLSLSALTEGRLITKRNIYYQDTDLFKRQSIVDNLVDDLAFTLGLGREDLGNVSDIGIGEGKGYPDLNTKQFVHLLHIAKSELPIFALVDFDCYGIAIMRCYSYGTRGHAHERATTVPSMQWLGIKSDDLAFRQGAIPTRGPDINGSQRRPGPSLFDSTSSLTLRDRTRAINMIKEIDEDGTDNDRDCRRELQVMLFLGIKAEIQAVDNTGDMSRWLDEHLRTF